MRPSPLQITVGAEGTPDSTPPVITVTGLADGMTIASAELSFTVAAEDETDGPVTPLVRLGDTVLTPAEGGSYTCTLAEGSNTITVEASDAAGNKAQRTYTVYYQPASGADTAPPAFAAGYPRAEKVTTAGFVLKLQLDEPGTVYYRVVGEGADPGSDYETWTAVPVPGTGEVVQTVGGLAPGQAYDVYVIARDAAGNLQAAPVKLDVTTLAEDTVISRVREAIARVTNYVKSNQTYSSDWLVVGLRNAGEEIPAGYLSEVEAAVQNYFATWVNTKLEKVTDHERRVLGIVAAGGDPRNVGGYNLLERIYNFYIPANPPTGPSQPRDITFQGLNGVIYGLIALDTMRWPIPEDARYSRDWLIQYLLDHQNADGGWDLGATGNSDVDITAMTLIGLAPYHDRQEVMEAINRGVAWLSQKQSDEGGYYSWGTYNSESVSQTIIALCANGIDPTSEQFTKNGKNLLDALLSFLQEDGSILHTLDGSGVTGMATEQGYQALLAYDKFVKNDGAYNGGRTSIYYFGEYGTVKVAGIAADPSVTMAAGNRTVAGGDNAWTVQVTSGTVKDNVSAADLALTGLPTGLSAGAFKGAGNTIVITVSGTADLAVSRLTTVSVVVKGSAVTKPGAIDSEVINVFLSPAAVRGQEVTVSEEQKDITLDEASPNATVVVPAGITDARINIVPLVTEAGGVKAATLPSGLTIQADTPVGLIQVEILAGTAISAPVAWTGTINVPSVKPNSSVTVTPDPGKTAAVHAVVEVGFDDVPINFDRAVRMVFPGQAGKEVGYYRGGAFTRITTVMTSDTREAGDALPAGGDGRIDVGPDLVVWTRHFTRFVIYTQSATGGGQPPSSDSVSVYIRVEGYDRTVAPRTRITVDNFDLTPYLGPASGSSAEPSPGWGPDKLTKPTVAHALIRALESVGIDCTDHSSGLDLQDYGWALYVAMIAGDREFDHRSTSGWLYRVNGWLPNYGCQAYTLKGGEDIFWYFAAYGFETWYSQLTASKTSVKTGEEITLTLTGTKTDLSGSSGSGPTVSAKLKGAVIYVDGQEYKPEGTAVVTDENGKAVIKFNNPGTYEVSAERFSGEGLRDIVRPLPVKITVSGSAIASGGSAAPVSDTALEEAIQKADATGLVTLQADSAQNLLALSRDQLSKIWEAKKPLAVTVQGVQFILSADSLKVPELTAANAAQLQLKAEKLSAEDAQGLVATLAGQSRLVGEVYELDLVVVDKEGRQQSITQLPDCRVLLPVPAAAREAAAAGRVKAHRYNEGSKMWEEVGGTYDPAGGFISFKAEHFSKYALLESLSPAGTAGIKTFQDIQGHWAQKEIEYMAAKGYVAGVGDNCFAPEATVTRAQFAVIAARLAGLTARP
ncbi:MAG: DUF4430 domain-containing protein, partial [Peptococcaceae bacterium]|nr:DUF4430 domain-containing protein [Peptococcaceae bacterium]